MSGETNPAFYQNLREKVSALAKELTYNDVPTQENVNLLFDDIYGALDIAERFTDRTPAEQLKAIKIATDAIDRAAVNLHDVFHAPESMLVPLYDVRKTLASQARALKEAATPPRVRRSSCIALPVGRSV